MDKAGFVFDRPGRKLPHKQLRDCVVFVTWRLFFSIPQYILEALKEQKEKGVKERAALQTGSPYVNTSFTPQVMKPESSACESSSEEPQFLAHLQNNPQFEKFDDLINRYTHKEHNLVSEPYLSIIKRTIFHDDGLKYDLFAYCIMPNHVHIVLKPLAMPVMAHAPCAHDSEAVLKPLAMPVTAHAPCAHDSEAVLKPLAVPVMAHAPCAHDSEPEYAKITKITRDIKSVTAHKINQALRRTGRFWMPESYDHIIRTESELLKTLEYTLNNPVKAGLAQNWELWAGNYLSKQFY